MSCAVAYLVRVYSLSPECRFMAENVPIQPLNRLSLPIFHVTNSGLKDKTEREKRGILKQLNYRTCTDDTRPCGVIKTVASDIKNPPICLICEQNKLP